MWNSSPNALSKSLERRDSDEDSFLHPKNLNFDADDDPFEEWTEFSDSNLSLPQFSFHDGSDEEFRKDPSLSSASSKVHTRANDGSPCDSENLSISSSTEKSGFADSNDEENLNVLSVEGRQDRSINSPPNVEIDLEKKYHSTKTVASFPGQLSSEDTCVDADSDHGSIDDQKYALSCNDENEFGVLVDGVQTNGTQATDRGILLPSGEHPISVEDISLEFSSGNRGAELLLTSDGFLSTSGESFTGLSNEDNGVCTDNIRPDHEDDGQLEKSLEKLDLHAESPLLETCGDDSTDYEDTDLSDASSNFHANDSESSYDEIQQ